jgi:phage baseplate assembly protein gpV
MFIPDVMMKGVTIAENNGVCLQSLDGSVSVVLLADKVVITAPEVEVNGETKITMTSPEIEFDSPNCIMGGIRFNTHEHTGVQTGSGQSDGPTNP